MLIREDIFILVDSSIVLFIFFIWTNSGIYCYISGRTKELRASSFYFPNSVF